MSGNGIDRLLWNPVGWPMGMPNGNGPRAQRCHRRLGPKAAITYKEGETFVKSQKSKPNPSAGAAVCCSFSKWTRVGQLQPSTCLTLKTGGPTLSAWKSQEPRVLYFVYHRGGIMATKVLAPFPKFCLFWNQNSFSLPTCKQKFKHETSSRYYLSRFNGTNE